MSKSGVILTLFWMIVNATILSVTYIEFNRLIASIGLGSIVANFILFVAMITLSLIVVVVDLAIFLS